MKTPILDIGTISQHASADDPFFVKHKIAAIKSILVLPLYEESKLAGLLYLDSSRTAAFSAKSSLELIQLLAVGACVAIERAHTLKTLSRNAKNLEHIVRVRTAAAEAAAAKAQQASLVQNRFLTRMSHELRSVRILPIFRVSD